MRTEEQQRVYEARAEARQFGYSLLVEDAAGGDPSAAYVASGAPYLGSGHAAFPARSPTAPRLARPPKRASRRSGR